MDEHASSLTRRLSCWTLKNCRFSSTRVQLCRGGADLTINNPYNVRPLSPLRQRKRVHTNKPLYALDDARARAAR